MSLEPLVYCKRPLIHIMTSEPPVNSPPLPQRRRRSLLSPIPHSDRAVHPLRTHLSPSSSTSSSSPPSTVLYRSRRIPSDLLITPISPRTSPSSSSSSSVYSPMPMTAIPPRSTSTSTSTHLSPLVMPHTESSNRTVSSPLFPGDLSRQFQLLQHAQDPARKYRAMAATAALEAPEAQAMVVDSEITRPEERGVPLSSPEVVSVSVTTSPHAGTPTGPRRRSYPGTEDGTYMKSPKGVSKIRQEEQSGNAEHPQTGRKRSSAVAFNGQEEEAAKEQFVNRRPSLPGIKNLFGIAGSSAFLASTPDFHASPASARSTTSTFPDLQILSQSIQTSNGQSDSGASPTASSAGLLSWMGSFAASSERDRDSITTVPSRSSGESWWSGGSRSHLGEGDELERKPSFARFAFGVEKAETSRKYSEDTEDEKTRRMSDTVPRPDQVITLSARQQRHISYPFGEDPTSREGTPKVVDGHRSLISDRVFNTDDTAVRSAAGSDYGRPPPLRVPTPSERSLSSSRGSITTAASEANERERRAVRMAKEAGVSYKGRQGSLGPTIGPYASNSDDDHNRRASVQIPPDAVHAGIVYNWPESNQPQHNQRTFFEWERRSSRPQSPRSVTSERSQSYSLPQHGGVPPISPVDRQRHSVPADHPAHPDFPLRTNMSRGASSSDMPPFYEDQSQRGGLEQEMWRKRAGAGNDVYPSVLRRDLPPSSAPGTSASAIEHPHPREGPDRPQNMPPNAHSSVGVQRTFSAPHMPSHSQISKVSVSGPGNGASSNNISSGSSGGGDGNAHPNANANINPNPNTNTNANANGNTGTSISGPRYVCPACGKSFSRPSSLRIHTYSHSGERPFRCTFPGCQRAFSVQSNLKRHAKIHYQNNNNNGEGQGQGQGHAPPPARQQQQPQPHGAGSLHPYAHPLPHLHARDHPHPGAHPHPHPSDRPQPVHHLQGGQPSPTHFSLNVNGEPNGGGSENLPYVTSQGHVHAQVHGNSNSNSNYPPHSDHDRRRFSPFDVSTPGRSSHSQSQSQQHHDAGRGSRRGSPREVGEDEEEDGEEAEEEDELDDDDQDHADERERERESVVDRKPDSSELDRARDRDRDRDREREMARERDRKADRERERENRPRPPPLSLSVMR